MSDVKVYTVNGAVAGSSFSIPDWLTKTRLTKTKGKRALREHVEDGHHVIATGTYKPQIRVWDLDELSPKFERHGDAENSIHVQNDRTIELHTQSGFHYRTHIPRFGRSIAYTQTHLVEF
ncbi:hypothetical protein V8E55_010152 [Tylopilus felleus]